MRTAGLMIIAALCIGLPGLASAASDDDCKAMWEKANQTNDDSLNGEEAKPYADALRASGKEVQEDDAGSGPVIKQADFMTACKSDVFKGVEPVQVQ